MNFKDSCQKFALIFDVSPAKIMAFIEVESSGRAFYIDSEGKHKPLIRYEGHYLWRLLPHEGYRRVAQAAGFASPLAGGVKNPRRQENRYALLEGVLWWLTSYSLDRDLAFQSISMGMGQIMGANYKDLGFQSARAMFDSLIDETMDSDSEDQIEMIMLFLEANNLLGLLRREKWTKLARAYNGPGYHKNCYDRKLENAAIKWELELVKKGEHIATAKHLSTLRVGSRGLEVRFLQQKLRANGLDVGPVDSEFGPLTKTMVEVFQRKHELVADGIVGQQTWRELTNDRADTGHCH